MAAITALLLVPLLRLGAASEVVYYLGDPQIGFSGNATMDTMRFRMAAFAAAHGNATAVVVAGDLVNAWNNDTQISDYKQVWPVDFPSGVHLVPGNHDLDSECKDADVALGELAHYHKTFGADDYSDVKTRYSSLIMVNSEMLLLPHLGLNGTTDPRILQPVETQWSWLEESLKVAASEANVRPHVILVMHHPPFLQKEDEAHQYFNMPLVPRHRILALARKYNVSHILCGHTHTTRNVSTTDGRIRILTTAGTAKAFDDHGCGYRTLSMTATSLDIAYVEFPAGGGTPGCTKTKHPRFSAPEHEYMYEYLQNGVELQRQELV